jgi:hypothetical protein
VRPLSWPKYSNSGRPLAAAAARTAAIETPSTALAPRRLFVGVPSSSINRRSIAR